MTGIITFDAATGDDRTDDDADGESTRAVTDGGTVPDGGSARQSVTDPVAVRSRPGVEATERTFVHDERDHCEAGAAGRAIVGVTDEDGAVLLWVHRERGHAILPNVTVAPGADWAAAARDDVAETAGLAVDLDGVERVRAVNHEVPVDADASEGDHRGSDAPSAGGPTHQQTTHRQTTHHVVFSASPAVPAAQRDGPTVDTCDDEWTAGWYDDLPADPDVYREASVLDDIRLFLD
jgi:hypothetical protein